MKTAAFLPSEAEMRTKVCNQCFFDESNPHFKVKCPATESGKHRLRPRVLWAGVVVADTFDVRSEQSALSFFGEGCWTSECYALARQLTGAEIAQLRKGEKKLELRLVAALPPKADKQTKRKLKVNPAGVIAFDFTEEVGRPKRKVALPPKADKQTKRKLKVNPNVIAASDLYEAGRKILEERKK